MVALDVIKIKSFLGTILYPWEKPSHPQGIYIFNLHGTQKKFIQKFENLVDFIEENFQVLSPSSLEKELRNPQLSGGPYAVLTFDDGIKNNVYAAKILAARRISAYFFVIPDFVNCQKAEQHNYFKKHIRTILDPTIDSEDEDLSSMTWDDIKILQELGHSIGSHSQSHTLKAGDSLGKALVEIVGSKEEIQRQTGSPCTSFCAPFNSFLSTGKNEMALIREHYEYCFSTFAGLNLNRDPYIIERINVESFWPSGAVKFALSTWDIKRYQEKIEKFRLETS